jgi:hypothetical protein
MKTINLVFERGYNGGVTDAEMSDNGIRVVFIIEERDKEGIVALTPLDGTDYLTKDLLRRIHKDLIQMLFLANLVENRV